MFRPAVAPFPSSVNTRVNRQGLGAHLRPVLSLKELLSFRVLSADSGFYIFLQAGLVAKLTSSSVYIYSTRVRGFSCPACSVLQRFEILLLPAVYIERSVVLWTVACAEIYSDRRLLWYMHKVAAFRRPHDRSIWFLNKRRRFAVCAVVPVRCPL